MATITLEVPDEIARRPEEISDRLPLLLTALLEYDDFVLPADIDVQSRPWKENIQFMSRPPDVYEIITVQLLLMNEPSRVKQRAYLQATNRYPAN